jgi:myo-inositol-1(or 4)-monophosphatase
VFTREFRVAVAAAQKAAMAINGFQRSEIEVQYKSPIEPVTEVDMIADRILKEALTEAFPDYGWLSEESLDGPDRLLKSLTWVVDPLDGTREFIAGRPEYCVSVGLVADNEPVLGVIVNPVSGSLFTAITGEGAFLNGAPIHVSDSSQAASYPTLVSRSETRRELLTKYLSVLNLQPTGGMCHKLSLVASGNAGATFTCYPRNEWDLAAGTVILQEAGGVVTRLDGTPLRFNQPSPEIVGIAASNGQCHQELLALINDV